MGDEVVGDELGEVVGDELGDELGEVVGDELGDELGEVVGDTVGNFVAASNTNIPPIGFSRTVPLPPCSDVIADIGPHGAPTASIAPSWEKLTLDPICFNRLVGVV